MRLLCTLCIFFKGIKQITTIESIVAANEDLNAALENYIAAVKLSTPFKSNGYSLALEEASEDAVESAKETAWQKFKAWISRVVDWFSKKVSQIKGRFTSGKKAAEELKKKMQEDEDAVAAIKSFNNREADISIITTIRQTMFNLMNVSAAINKLADFGARSLNSLMLFATWDGDKCKSYKDVVRKINNELGDTFGSIDLNVGDFITRAIAEVME